jgi:hypothetical protein
MGRRGCTTFFREKIFSNESSQRFQLEYLYYHLLPFFGGGSHGNSPAPASKRDSKAPALTWEEHLKEEALAKMFGPVLMTTPKDMEKIMAESGL